MAIQSRIVLEAPRPHRAPLGHDRFAVTGHDREGRVAYRMALDHADRVRRGAARARLWHWAFLAQPAPLPERLIAGDPGAFFDLHVRALGLGARPIAIRPIS
jgi:haloacetate dehalogenase